MPFKITSKAALHLLFAIIAITSLLRHDVFTGQTNVVTWDGYGYYAYLPGAFVYGDVETYAFAEQHFADYEISSTLYQLMETDDGRRFPIYNIGLAVVWAPAFLVTHGIVAATGVAPADGLSYPYQLTVVLMSLLFAFLGFRFLRRFLLLHFADFTVAMTLLAVGLGTNIFYYIVERPDMTHGYLFALYAMFLYYFAKLSIATPITLATPPTSPLPQGDAYSGKWGPELSREREISRLLLLSGLIAGLLCLIRSSEIVVFAIPAFYGLRDWATLKRNFWRTLPIFGLALAVFSIQLIYYKVGTGNWWQDGYAGLGFDWLEPHLFEGFFGYRRGWLVYTPLMAVALIGVFRLPKRWRLPVGFFLIGNCYILFSWHIWWYGNTFGSRPVTQSYALLALPLAAFDSWLSGGDAGAKEGKGHRWSRRAIIPLLLFPFIALNLFQHWQYNQRILPLDFVSKTYYWHAFGRTTPDKKALVYRDTDEKLPAKDFTPTPLAAFDTLLVIPPKSSREYTNVLDQPLAASDGPDRWLRTTFAYTYYGDAFDKFRYPGLITELQLKGKTEKWVQVNIPATMDAPALDSLTFNISLPTGEGRGKVRQYFWNLSEDSMVVRAFRVELLTPAE